MILPCSKGRTLSQFSPSIHLRLYVDSFPIFSASFLFLSLSSLSFLSNDERWVASFHDGRHSISSRRARRKKKSSSHVVGSTSTWRRARGKKCVFSAVKPQTPLTRSARLRRFRYGSFCHRPPRVFLWPINDRIAAITAGRNGKVWLVDKLWDKSKWRIRINSLGIKEGVESKLFRE